MHDTDEFRPDLLDPFGIEVNGIAVSAFEVSGHRWYQLAGLFQALGLQVVGAGGLSAKPGNLFPDSEEFKKFKDTWYGTAEGLYLFANHLYKSKFWLTNEQDRETAQTRSRVILEWLSSLDSSAGTPDATDESGTAEQMLENGMEYESNADAESLPMEAGNELILPVDDVEISKPMDMPTTKSAGIDMALFDRMYDNLAARIPYLASCLSIPSDASAGEKMFAVLTIGFLHPNERIMRPQDDSDGLWGQEEYLHVSEAVRRSILFGQ